LKQFKEIHLVGSDSSVDNSNLVGWYAVVASKYRHFGWLYCLLLRLI